MFFLQKTEKSSKKFIELKLSPSCMSSIFAIFIENFTFGYFSNIFLILSLLPQLQSIMSVVHSIYSSKDLTLLCVVRNFKYSLNVRLFKIIKKGSSEISIVHFC